MAITGTGTELDPYIVHDISELETVSLGRGTYWTVNQVFYTKLANDIDAEGVEWPYLAPSGYYPRMILDLDNHHIINIGWVNASAWQRTLFEGDQLKNGYISFNAPDMRGSVCGTGGTHTVLFDNMKIDGSISFEPEYSSTWYYNSIEMFLNCSFSNCTGDLVVNFADMRGMTQTRFHKGGVFFYTENSNNDKFIENSDFHVTCNGCVNYYDGHSVEGIVATTTTQNVLVEKCRITGTVDGEDTTFNEFLGNEHVVYDTCVIDLDFSQCSMPSTFDAGTLIASDATTTVINTDSLSAFDGLITAGTGMIPCTYSEIRHYDDLTAVNFPVTRAGSTPPAGWSWFIKDGALPYLEVWPRSETKSKLYVGSQMIETIYIGDEQIAKAYLGDKLIYKLAT
jgi:hypothetical protein